MELARIVASGTISSWGAVMLSANFNSPKSSAVKYIRFIGWRRTAASLALLGGLALTACAPAPLMFGNFKDGDSSATSGPTVQQVVRHVDCELERAMASDPNLSALGRYQYVAQATLTLDVTDVEGFSPSLTLAPASLYATAANLGGQLTGTQHRTMTVTFQIDLAKLSHRDQSVAPQFYSEIRSELQSDKIKLESLDKILGPMNQRFQLESASSPAISELPLPDKKKPTAAQQSWAKERCPLVAEHVDDFSENATLGNLSSSGETPIGGDLGLKESLRDGLLALYANSIYGALTAPPSPKETPLPGSGCSDVPKIPLTPSSDGATPTPGKPTDEKCDPEPSATFRFGPMKDQPGVFNAKYFAGSSSGSPPSNPTTFSSTVDFTVVEGLTGGPTWSLQYLKGPASGGSGPLSLNRTAKDTMLIAFTARCDSLRAKKPALKNPKNYFETLDGCASPDSNSGLADVGLFSGQPSDAQTQDAIRTNTDARTYSVLQSLSLPGH